MYKQLPNLLTLLRLVLAAVFFVVLNQYRYAGADGDPQSVILWVALILFVCARSPMCSTVIWARRWEAESRFGRIMDPVCDKVLVLGAFIYLAGPRFVIPERPDTFFNMVSGVYPWMVVVILARELVVTSIRAELEATGHRFPAGISGKLKMGLQSVTVPVVLGLIWLGPEQNTTVAWIRDGLVYATVIVTILSGLPYITGARKAIRNEHSGAQS